MEYMSRLQRFKCRPIDTESYSGKFVLRLPKSLHCRLAMEAEKEGVSLNQYALYKLAQ